jgi:fructose-bisphosphate aldolase class II
MKTLKYYLKKAEKEKWAIGQFNFSNLKILEAIIRAAVKLKAPVILGTSEGESKSIGLEQAVILTKSYRKETKLPIFLNLDHGKTLNYIKKAIDAGYDAVHFDGSNYSLQKNINLTKKVVKYARKSKALVEGEIGVVGQAKGTKEVSTNPSQALKFVKETGVDSLAIAIGNLHGIKASGINPKLDLKRLKEIKKKVSRVPLVLHGGSGTPKKDIKAAIKLGIVKININTEIRMAYTNTLRKVLKKKPKEITPYKYMPQVGKAVQKVVEEKIKLFKSRNRS